MNGKCLIKYVAQLFSSTMAFLIKTTRLVSGQESLEVDKKQPGISADCL